MTTHELPTVADMDRSITLGGVVDHLVNRDVDHARRIDALRPCVPPEAITLELQDAHRVRTGIITVASELLDVSTQLIFELVAEGHAAIDANEAAARAAGDEGA